MSVLGNLFGGGKKQAPQPQGPDPEQVKAQRRSERRANQKEAEQRRELGTRERIANARTRRGSPITLFAPTGEAGVSLRNG